MDKKPTLKKTFPFIMESKLRPVTTLNGKNYLYFAGTSYYQLHAHSEIIASAVEATRQWGIGAATSRTINGTTPLLLKLEKKIADFFETEDAAYLPSGYLSNLAGIQALEQLQIFDRIFIDEKAHYSNLAGARGTGKKVIQFSHLDADNLEKKIKKHLKKGEKPLIVSDGLFPIMAEVPPVPAYLKIAEAYDGAIWIDDAHGAGILGEHGRGLYEYFNLSSDRLYSGGTLSKAFGAYGGFIIGDNRFIHTVKSGEVMTGTNSPPSAIAGAASRGIEMIKNNPEFLRRLKSNALYLKAKIKSIGIAAEENAIPIVAFSSGNAEKMEKIQQMLMNKGIYIQFVKYIGAGSEGILRIVVSSAHTKEEIDFLVNSLAFIL